MDALKRVGRSFKHFSKFMLPYGFGARTVEGDGPACKLFAMSGNFDQPFVENED